ncbi:MAG: hypothetical protein FWG83_03475 [Oscillospiraceae bacterium]|nr:hypothetical protein [Oscillospiraceae bacterium]
MLVKEGGKSIWKLNGAAVPKDVEGLCEQVARGYERRKRDHERRRFDIMYSGGSGFIETGGRSAGNIGDPCARKAERLEKLDCGLDARLIKAVDESLFVLCADVSRDLREKLMKSILLNCESGRDYPYEQLGIDEFSRTDFYRRKRRFIRGIGVVLGLVE